jgi:hypothetical protein
MTFTEVLEYASGPGVAVIVGILLSFAVEYWRGYAALTPKYKRLVFLGLSLAVPVLAMTLRGVCGHIAWSWDDQYWPALWSGGLAFASGTVTHLRKLPDAPEVEA